MNKIDWSQVYVASSQLDLLSTEDVEFVRSQCGKLPEGYEEFVTTFGSGHLCEIYVLNRKQLDGGFEYFRDKLNEWLLFTQDEDLPSVIPDQFALDAVPLATTDWGDDYFCSPSEPGMLWFIPTGWDWPERPARVPLGFANPFWHQVPGEEPELLQPGHLIFRPRLGQTFRKVHLLPQSNTPGGIADLWKLLKSLIPTDLDDSLDGTLQLYVGRWGARFMSGKVRDQDEFIFSCVIDEGWTAEFDRLVDRVCESGYQRVELPL